MLRDPSLIPLSHQHQHGLAFCVMLRRSLTADETPANVARLAARVADLFQVELSNHFEMEEQVLFPACGPLPLIPELIADHRTLESLCAQLRSAPSPQLLDEFCERLSTHIRREERELFEAIQRDLPRDVIDALGREIDRRAVRACLPPI
jgi:hemerythrin-like domain-containing protein